MSGIFFSRFLLFFVIASHTLTPRLMAQQGVISLEEAEAIGQEVYIFGYPLVTMEMTRRMMTNVSSPDGLRAPMGQFANARTYRDASFHDVTAPNVDTLYSSAWLDLSKEPYILHLPKEDDRYYLMPILNAWTEVFASLGTRTTGAKAGNYVITGPNWKGLLPEGVKEIKSTTNLVWILGRTYCQGTSEDYNLVHKIQDEYALTPLSFFGKSFAPSIRKVDPKIDSQTLVRDHVNSLDAGAFFKELALLMKDNPSSQEDFPLVRKMAKIGIIPGEEFDPSKLSPIILNAFKSIPKKSLETILAHQAKAGRLENGWIVTSRTGNYGTDYLQRAFIALKGLGENLPQDSQYAEAQFDQDGKRLTGDNRYVITFEKEQIPPVKEFWTLTLYDPQYFLVENPFNRFSLSSKDSLKYNPDGSLNLYVQKDSPGLDKETNWLPAPVNNFNLMFRFYWPDESIVTGSWKPPLIKSLD